MTKLQPMDIGILVARPKSLYDRLEVWALTYGTGVDLVTGSIIAGQVASGLY